MGRKNGIDSNTGSVKSILICLGVILIGVVVTVVIFNTEPVAEREGAVKRTAMLVDVVEAVAGNFRPDIKAVGTVKAAREIMLSPLVGGEIVEVAENFTPGGFVSKGDVLLRIDPQDYQYELIHMTSDYWQAQAEMEIEMGRQNVAKEEFEMLDDSLNGHTESLVLREPQLNIVRAEVDSAKAAMDMADLNLSRTNVKAPFDGQVIEQNVDLGSQVSSGNHLARLVGVNEYWVEVSVPLAKLNWLTFPKGSDDRGALVKVRNRTAWPDGVYRDGELYRLIGKLESDTRMARVLVSIKDPLNLQRGSEAPPLLIDSFVEVAITAKELQNVVRLKRDYMRRNDTVWVMQDGKLDIRETGVIFRDKEHVYIEKGLEAGEKIVVTNLSSVVDGADLRLKETESE